MTGAATYSGKAQPYLDAIASGVFASQEVRDWLLIGTPAERSYLGAAALEEQARALRPGTKQPFWANHWCGLDSRCTCRAEGSKSLESDAIFFLRNADNRVLAVHLEFKHASEPFRLGQPEGYPLRAACFAATQSKRKALHPHHDWATVLFCGPETVSDARLKYFQRVITHDEARKMIPLYPP